MQICTEAVLMVAESPSALTMKPCLCMSLSEPRFLYIYNGHDNNVVCL